MGHAHSSLPIEVDINTSKHSIGTIPSAKSSNVSDNCYNSKSSFTYVATDDERSIADIEDENSDISSAEGEKSNASIEQEKSVMETDRNISMEVKEFNKGILSTKPSGRMLSPSLLNANNDLNANNQFRHVNTKDLIESLEYLVIMMKNHLKKNNNGLPEMGGKDNGVCAGLVGNALDSTINTLQTLSDSIGLPEKVAVRSCRVAEKAEGNSMQEVEENVETAEAKPSPPALPDIPPLPDIMDLSMEQLDAILSSSFIQSPPNLNGSFTQSPPNVNGSFTQSPPNVNGSFTQPPPNVNSSSIHSPPSLNSIFAQLSQPPPNLDCVITQPPRRQVRPSAKNSRTAQKQRAANKDDRRPSQARANKNKPKCKPNPKKKTKRLQRRP